MSTPTNIGITGFPNAGKTTVFNALTDSQERVENWPGVTTAHASQAVDIGDQTLCFFDLPSSPQYHTTHTSLPHQPETRFDAIVYVLDATCFTQQMPMVLEWCETGYPLMVVISKYEAAQALGLRLDPDKLSKHLGCPIHILQDEATDTACAIKAILTNLKPQPAHQQHWTKTLKQHNAKLSYQKPDAWHIIPNLHLFLNTHLLPKTITPSDKLVSLNKKTIDKQLCACRKQAIERMKQQQAWRYSPPISHSKVDAILTHSLGGPIVMVTILYLLFFLCSTLTQCLRPIIDLICYWGYQHSAPLSQSAWLKAALQGLFIGLNTTLTFLPMIFLLYLGLAWMEQSGYTLRISYITHRWMQSLRLPGKALIPLLLGFSCNVPAIFGARTLCHPGQRIVTSLIAPFVPCSARLAIFTLIGLALFPPKTAIVFIGALYGISILIAFICGITFSRWLDLPEGENALPLLPAYRWPSMAPLARATWDKTRGFLLRAGRIILPASAAIVALSHTLPQSQHTWLSMHWLTPLGLAADHWQAGIGLLTGVVAKEVMIGALSALYHPGLEAPLGFEAANLNQVPALIWQAIGDIPHHFLHPFSDIPSHTLLNAFVDAFQSKQAAIAFALFTALYVPCISTLVTLYREFSRPWALFSLIWSVAIAYFVGSNFYQWAHHEPHAAIWTLLSSLTLFCLGLACRQWLRYHLPTLLQQTPQYTSPCSKGCATPCRD